MDDHLIESFSRYGLEVLYSIQKELADKLVTPTIAFSAIKKWVLPHCDQLAKDLIEQLSQPGWLDLYEMYLKIDYSTTSDETREMAEIIELIVTFSKLPPRKVSPRQSLDTTYYLITCEDRGKNINQIRYTENGLDVFKFCKYCWRHPVPGRYICAHHSAHSSDYLASYRIKQLFDCYTFEKSSLETFEFLEADYHFSYFLPTKHIYNWLLNRRPNVADQLRSTALPLNDKNIVNSLLKMLQPTHEYHWSALEASRAINNWILRYPELIWPMLLRAETWFELRNQIHHNWGGNKTRGKQTQTNYVLPPVNLAEKWIT
ncbi:hypothetical protein [Methylophilus sp. YYY-1]|uniref:hypothetical protein n=1 Tax=Methylophilus sp. YYY-1 TaxID=2682087 RepID=UPI0023B2F085|nr:hypothetical protein [Methylophilus sp. YYY-1]MDF0379030.1 hypothetical protein [Methylophilus sp. YYY-1]